MTMEIHCKSIPASEKGIQAPCTNTPGAIGMKRLVSRALLGLMILGLTMALSGCASDFGRAWTKFWGDRI